MSELTLEEFISVLAEKMDACELVEELEISSEDLLDKFTDTLIKYRWKFRDIEEEYIATALVPWNNDEDLSDDEFIKD